MPNNKKSNPEGIRVMLPDDKNLLEKKEESLLEEPSYTIAEGNLQRHHFASLGSKSKEKKKLVSVVEEELIDKQGVKQLTRWKVIGGGELGLPTWLDKKVFVAVVDIARTLSYPVKNPIPVSISDLCRRVGFNPQSGRNRAKVKSCLARISDTTIEAVGSFYFKEQEACISDRFSVFQRVIFANATLEDGSTATRNLVWLSEKIISNINNWHIVPVDTKFFMKLVPIAGRLYELLSNRFFGLFMSLSRAKKSRDGCYVVESYEDICKKLPLTERKYISRAKEQFHKAHRQLLNSGYLAKVEWLESNEIRYYPGPKAYYDFDNAQREVTRQMALPFNPRELSQYREKLTLQLEGSKDPKKDQITIELVPDDEVHIVGEEKPVEGHISAFMKELEKRGVSHEQAKGLTEDYGVKTMEWGGGTYPVLDFYMQFYDWMLNRKDEKRPESGAWLVDAIRKGWMPPNKFRTKEQIAEARAKKEEREIRQKELERKRQEEEERKQYFDWLKKTPAERWESERFWRILMFKRKHGREPTHAELTEDKQNYKKNPESPEEYQKRIFGKVKFPLEV